MSMEERCRNATLLALEVEGPRAKVGRWPLEAGKGRREILP